MAEIHPFRGVRYNQGLAKDLADVICPPYDIITPQLQQELYHRSSYNFVQIENRPIVAHLSYTMSGFYTAAKASPNTTTHPYFQ